MSSSGRVMFLLRERAFQIPEAGSRIPALATPEMESIADRAQNNQSDFFDTSWTSGNSTINSMNAVFSNFIQLQYYWTSTTNAADVTEAWTVFSCDYGVYDIAK